MRRSLHRTGALLRASCGLSVALCLPLGVGSAQEPIPLGMLVERLDRYLVDYEAQISAVVADESQVQRVEQAHILVTLRRLESEVAFLRLPGDREWLGHRRVRRVDGVAVPSSDPRALAELFASGTAEGQRVAGALVEASARHSLGLPRSVNVPTLPLELAHPRRRHAYTVALAGHETVGGQRLARLELTERGPGRIVHYGPASYFHTRVRLWIQETDGAVHRVQAILQAPETLPDMRGTPEVRVDFTHHTGLNMLVPTAMHETFIADRATGRAEATYRNFRRFSVSARVLPGAK